MNSKLKRILALLLALAMVFALAACGDDDDKKSGDDSDDGKKQHDASGGSGTELGDGLLGNMGKGGLADNTPVVTKPDPMTDPDVYLEAAMEVTSQDLMDRTNVEPMNSIGEILASDSSALGVEIGAVVPSSGMDNISFSGTLYGDASDIDNIKLRLDGALTMESQGASMVLDAGLYLDPDFVGVYFPYLTGTDAFYGLQPHDFYDQAVGSIFDESTGSMFGGLDLEAMKQLDEAMAALADAIASIPVDNLTSDLENLTDDIDLDVSLSTQEQKVDYKGSQVDGYAISSSVSGEQMAGVLENVSSKLFESDILEFVLGYLEGTGEVTREELDDAVSDAKQEIQSIADAFRQNGISLEIIYYIADDRVVSTEIILNGVDNNKISLIYDFYGSDGNTISFTIPEFEGVSMSVTETVDTSTGFANTTTMQLTAEGNTVLCNSTQNWDSASGHYSVSTVMDMTGENVDPANSHVELQFDGTLTLSNGTFTFVSDELSLDAGGEQITLVIAVSGAKDVNVPTPAEKVNVFEMSEADLQALMQNLSALM